MIYLFLRILFTVLFSHLLRFSQARCRRPLLAATVNYLVAAVAGLLWTLSAKAGWNGHTALLGAIAGLTYVTSLMLILPSMRISGVSITGAVVQLSLMAPVATAIWRFGELPNHWQFGGIGLTLIALPLLSAGRSTAGEPARSRLSPLILLLFASTGISQVVMKEFSALRPPSDLPLYTFSLFATSTLCTALWLAFDDRKPKEPDTEPSDATAPAPRRFNEWSVGIVLGTANVLQLVSLLLALRVLPAVIVFPVSAAMGIAANALASAVLWGERPSPAAWMGIGLSIGAVVLLNVR